MTEMTIHESTTAFINHLRENGKKERTLYTYRKDLDLIEGYFGKDKKLQELRITQVGKFLKCDALLKLGNGNARAERTIAKTIRVFRMMLVWAKDTGLIDELPLPKSTPMGHSKQTEVIDAEQQ
jgi:site-specific recombinase XerD